MEASYYDNIMEQQRLEPEFFRVGFYGRKFPFFLRVSPSRITRICIVHIIHLKFVFFLSILLNTSFHRTNLSTKGIWLATPDYFSLLFFGVLFLFLFCSYHK